MNQTDTLPLEDRNFHSWNLAIESIMMVVVDLNCSSTRNIDNLVNLKGPDCDGSSAIKVGFHLNFAISFWCVTCKTKISTFISVQSSALSPLGLSYTVMVVPYSAMNRTPDLTSSLEQAS